MNRLLPAMCVVIALTALRVLLPDLLPIASKHHIVHHLLFAATIASEAKFFKTPYAPTVTGNKAFSITQTLSKTHMPAMEKGLDDLSFCAYANIRTAQQVLLAKTLQNPIYPVL
jgi:hypothetical protein